MTLAAAHSRTGHTQTNCVPLPGATYARAATPRAVPLAVPPLAVPPATCSSGVVPGVPSLGSSTGTGRPSESPGPPAVPARPLPPGVPKVPRPPLAAPPLPTRDLLVVGRSQDRGQGVSRRPGVVELGSRWGALMGLRDLRGFRALYSSLGCRKNAAIVCRRVSRREPSAHTPLSGGGGVGGRGEGGGQRTSSNVELQDVKQVGGHPAPTHHPAPT